MSYDKLATQQDLNLGLTSQPSHHSLHIGPLLTRAKETPYPPATEATPQPQCSVAPTLTICAALRKAMTVPGISSLLCKVEVVSPASKGLCEDS